MSVKEISSSDDVLVSENVAPVNDGERLRALLDRHGLKPGDLQRVVGKSRQMVHIYLTTPRFTPNMREMIREGLSKLKIDPSEFVDDPLAIADAGELRRLLERIPSDALPDLKRMLEIQDRATRIGLIALIEDRIERRK